MIAVVAPASGVNLEGDDLDGSIAATLRRLEKLMGEA